MKILAIETSGQVCGAALAEDDQLVAEYNLQFKVTHSQILVPQMETIREMIRFAGDAIEILPGAGITLENVERVVAETGCTQVHLARHRTLTDTSVANNREIYYGGCLYPPEDRIEITDREYVAAVKNKVK